MDHLVLLQKERNKQKGSYSKTLVSRALGRFYTPEPIASTLIDGIYREKSLFGKKTIRIIDPFCGDGRLIEMLLKRMRYPCPEFHMELHLWDCDIDALELAHDTVQNCVNELCLNAKLYRWVGDTFRNAPLHFGTYDIVITNPPWDILKPDRRELDLLSEKDRNEYVRTLKSEDFWLTKNYPTSQPHMKMYGWGTNLARVGTEVALRLSSKNGICGIVSPASLFADQTSGKLREWMSKNFNIKKVCYFPAESRLFDNVDQSTVSFISIPSDIRGQKIKMTVFDKNTNVVSDDLMYFKTDDFAVNAYSIPLLFGPFWIRLLSRFANLPTFGFLEGQDDEKIWAGRELDETGHKAFLCNDGKYLFVKGKMIKRYGFEMTPECFVRRDDPPIPESAEHERIAWRDVSRPTQKRRMQATIIPPKWVSGNSLHVAYFRNDNKPQLLALLALMNSFVFELQVRSFLSTSHLSLGVIRQVHIPDLNSNSLVDQLAPIVARCLRDDEEAKIEIEVAVAQAYGLSKKEFELILNQFDKIPEKQKIDLLSSQIWNSKKTLC